MDNLGRDSSSGGDSSEVYDFTLNTRFFHLLLYKATIILFTFVMPLVFDYIYCQSKNVLSL